MTQAWLLEAARNNAEWCDAMCRAHGLPGTFSGPVWSNPRRTPPYYPDAVTLAPAATADDVLDPIDRASAGASVKDSFACLDLSGAGFGILFDAEWIIRFPGAGRPAGEPRAATGDPITWGVVEDASGLRTWEAGLHGGTGDGLFPPALLADPSVAVLAGRIGGDIVCGAVLSTSGRVVGLSNVFASGCDLDAVWDGAVATAARLFPDRPVVGYESGEDLDHARSRGFQPIGRLRVWIA
ncbi:hypothetical protein GCM10010517_41300 [Streptosporangium fragile]|uniref:GNAT family N-acetyltransferase n=1 Tax=Streptosporangium fragile TaxID=46186 RepID=A0ABP6IIJ1_9ACTN